MSAFHIQISSPEGIVFEDEISFISLRGANGDLAVMRGHIPFITAIKPCNCKIEYEDGTVKTGKVKSGILTVAPDRVTLLSGDFSFDK